VDRRRFHGVFDFWSWRRYFPLRGSIASYPVNIACLCVSSRSITPSHVFAAYQTRRYQFHQLEHKRDKLRGRRFFGGTLAAHMRNRTRINVHLMVCVDALVVSLAHKLLDLSLTMLELEYLPFDRSPLGLLSLMDVFCTADTYHLSLSLSLSLSLAVWDTKTQACVALSCLIALPRTRNGASHLVGFRVPTQHNKNKSKEARAQSPNDGRFHLSWGTPHTRLLAPLAPAVLAALAAAPPSCPRTLHHIQTKHHHSSMHLCCASRVAPSGRQDNNQRSTYSHECRFQLATLLVSPRAPPSLGTVVHFEHSRIDPWPFKAHLRARSTASR